MFAAFPHWYASLFSALYIPLTLCLLFLIFRAVSIEYRGKGHTAGLEVLLDLGDGHRLGRHRLLRRGDARDHDHRTAAERTRRHRRRSLRLGSWPALLGGVGGLGFASRPRSRLPRPQDRRTTSAPVRSGGPRGSCCRPRCRSSPGSPSPITQRTWLVVPVVIAVIALIGPSSRCGRSREACLRFHGVYLVAGLGSVFAGAYPNVLPSTLDPANSLTIATASSSDYTLTVMLIVTVVILPVIIAYQIFSYRQFLGRIAETHIPEAHKVPVVIRS
jgi:cytochrome d ubiquinol oxidase subunit II